MSLLIILSRVPDRVGGLNEEAEVCFSVIIFAPAISVCSVRSMLLF